MRKRNNAVKSASRILHCVGGAVLSQLKDLVDVETLRKFGVLGCLPAIKFSKGYFIPTYFTEVPLSDEEISDMCIEVGDILKDEDENDKVNSNLGRDILKTIRENTTLEDATVFVFHLEQLDSEHYVILLSVGPLNETVEEFTEVFRLKEDVEPST